MKSTLSLLETALTQDSASAWARKFDMQPSAFTDAKKQGYLTPVLAGNLAIELGEDAAQWMATAVLEGAKESPAKARLIKRLSNMRRW